MKRFYSALAGLAVLSCALVVLVLAPSCAYAAEPVDTAAEARACAGLVDPARTACIDAAWDQLDERTRASNKPHHPRPTTPATPRPGVLNV